MTIYPVPKPVRVAEKVRPKGLKRSRMKSRGPRTKKSGGALFPKNVDRKYRAFVRGFSCWFCGLDRRTQFSPTECEHLKTRGSGGRDFDNILPTCAYHRTRRDVVGPKTFFNAYAIRGSDPWQAARRLTDLYRTTMACSLAPTHPHH